MSIKEYVFPVKDSDGQVGTLDLGPLDGIVWIMLTCLSHAYFNKP